MLSYFLVQHDACALFKLDETEWKDAIQTHPELLKESIGYQPRSANAFLQPGKEGYFDNSSILAQVERLFKLLKFKRCLANCEVEVIVDNARTHTAKPYDLNLLGEGLGTKCPYVTIEWEEDGEVLSVECFMDEEKTQSKGLFELAKELRLIKENAQSKDTTLPELRKICSSHKAFQETTRLELLAGKYDIRIVFCHKFHYELNPIEGLWCYMKNHIHRNTDQTWVDAF